MNLGHVLDLHVDVDDFRLSNVDPILGLVHRKVLVLGSHDDLLLGPDQDLNGVESPGVSPLWHVNLHYTLKAQKASS